MGHTHIFWLKLQNEKGCYLLHGIIVSFCVILMLCFFLISDICLINFMERDLAKIKLRNE
jgi:hypothetical protein